VQVDATKIGALEKHRAGIIFNVKESANCMHGLMTYIDHTRFTCEVFPLDRHSLKQNSEVEIGLSVNQVSEV